MVAWVVVGAWVVAWVVMGAWVVAWVVVGAWVVAWVVVGAWVVACFERSIYVKKYYLIIVHKQSFHLYVDCIDKLTGVDSTLLSYT